MAKIVTIDLTKKGTNTPYMLLRDLTLETASGKMFVWNCGCQSFQCFRKGDCSAKGIDCRSCADSRTFDRCSTHAGLPDSTKCQVLLV